MTLGNRATGYPVRVVDRSKLDAVIRDRVVNVHGGTEEDAMRYGAGSAVLVKTDKGVAYICTEGVGWWADEDGTIEVEFHSGMHIGYTAIPLEDVVACVSDQTVELADFIRTFGDRLDSNFWLWARKIDGIVQDWEV